MTPMDSALNSFLTLMYSGWFSIIIAIIANNVICAHHSFNGLIEHLGSFRAFRRFLRFFSEQTIKMEEKKL